MGLFDGLMNNLEGAASAAELAAHAPALKDALGELLAHPDHGGLQGMADSFKNAGLGGLMSSWVGTGQNQPVNAQQIAAGLGPKAVAFISQRTGLPADKVSAGLAFVLPLVINHLTPQGQVASSTNASEALKGLKL